jgi:hypothetical protein
MSSLALKGSLSIPEPAAVSHRGKRTPSVTGLRPVPPPPEGEE